MERLCPFLVALLWRQGTRRVQRFRSFGDQVSWNRQGAFQPVAPLAQVAPYPPESPQRPRQPQPGLRLA